jgi:hypothetical protein
MITGQLRTRRAPATLGLKEEFGEGRKAQKEKTRVREATHHSSSGLDVLEHGVVILLLDLQA